MALILGAIPYVTIGVLTHFDAAMSTKVQRVFTMLWLASGVFIGATLPFFSFSFRELIATTATVFTWNICTTGRAREEKILIAERRLEWSRTRGEGITEEDLKRWKLRRREELEREGIQAAELEMKLNTEMNEIIREAEVSTVERNVIAAARGKVEENRRTRDRGMLLVLFLSSLVFCTGAIGGFVVVGQMLKDYGSCVLIS